VCEWLLLSILLPVTARLEKNRYDNEVYNFIAGLDSKARYPSRSIYYIPRPFIFYQRLLSIRADEDAEIWFGLSC
jgi:hypothetical protein